MNKKRDRVGTQSVVMGTFSGEVGDRSVVIGPTDDRGNVILNRPMAVGFRAYAGPGSIAIGAYAEAGSESPRTLELIRRIIYGSGDRDLRVIFDNLVIELGKKEKNEGSIRVLWTAVETSATLAGAVDLVQQGTQLLRAMGLG